MSKLWGGRFSKPTNKLVEKFTTSIGFDKRLAVVDCIGSLLHIEVLKKAKLLNHDEYSKLKEGLNKIFDSTENSESFEPDNSFEDIHSYIQHLLEKKIGNVAYKLHTCRSRNDQVVFDTKLYCKFRIPDIQEKIAGLISALETIAEKNKHITIPGYTHLQHAIPIKLKHYFYAFVNMFGRDHRRLTNADKNIELTLGSGALAGTFIDSENYNVATKEILEKMNIGTIKISSSDNSIDTVSDRDFIIEILNCLAIIGMHLSRFSEDLILWASKEFDFIDIDEAFCTGSSLMPQKKNPDVLELIRGSTGTLYGNLVNVLVIMKGLPLTYNRDMQYDKVPLFNSFDLIDDELTITKELLNNITFKEDEIKKQLADESLYATDIADYLVKNGVPFKDAHNVIGKLIRKKNSLKNVNLKDIDDETLKNIHPLLNQQIINTIINPKYSVDSKKSFTKSKEAKSNRKKILGN